MKPSAEITAQEILQRARQIPSSVAPFDNAVTFDQLTVRECEALKAAIAAERGCVALAILSIKQTDALHSIRRRLSEFTVGDASLKDLLTVASDVVLGITDDVNRAIDTVKNGEINAERIARTVALSSALARIAQRVIGVHGAADSIAALECVRGIIAEVQP